jgi:hypothetical protein
MADAPEGRHPIMKFDAGIIRQYHLQGIDALSLNYVGVFICFEVERFKFESRSFAAR